MELFGMDIKKVMLFRPFTPKDSKFPDDYHGTIRIMSKTKAFPLTRYGWLFWSERWWMHDKQLHSQKNSVHAFDFRIFIAITKWQPLPPHHSSFTWSKLDSARHWVITSLSLEALISMSMEFEMFKLNTYVKRFKLVIQKYPMFMEERDATNLASFIAKARPALCSSVQTFNAKDSQASVLFLSM